MQVSRILELVYFGFVLYLQLVLGFSNLTHLLSFEGIDTVDPEIQHFLTNLPEDDEVEVIGNFSGVALESQISFGEYPRKHYGKGTGHGWGDGGGGGGRETGFKGHNNPKFNQNGDGVDAISRKPNRGWTSNDVPDIVLCVPGDKCHYFVHCATYPEMYLKARDRCCSHLKQAKGMCCAGTYPDEGNAESIGSHFKPYPRDVVHVPLVGPESLASAAKRGLDYLPVLQSIELKILEKGFVVQKGSPAHGHLLFFQTSSTALSLARDNLLILKATSYIQDKYFLNPVETGIGLQNYNFLDTVLGKFCPSSPKCYEQSKYRTLDGSCNNLALPKLGQSLTPLQRLIPPAYADGVWSPRMRRDGSPLPSPRLISLSLHPDRNHPDGRYSHLLMQFGQFIDHDLSHVPIFRLEDINGIDCCRGDEENADYAHPACFSIPLPPNDKLLHGERCMNFVRSMLAPRLDCSFGHADQLNQLTHWLDASQIYGNTEEQAASLRLFSGGLLRVTRDARGRHLLPLDLKDDSQCLGSGGNRLHCFVAGDKRVNEQIGLTTMHTIWLREHNRVAIGLKHQGLGLNDEELYQEARRIVIAEYQHIVYNEWLPIILGRRYMEVFGILPLYQGLFKNYDPSVDPAISNAFTTAAFRMGHTLVNGVYDLAGSSGAVHGKLFLENYFNNPHLLREPGALDSITKGFTTQPVQQFDPYVTTALRDRLFQNGNGFGMDLVSLNIQRGRDHGLPSYNAYRDLCRLGKARHFKELAPIIPDHKISLLEDVYETVDDIDLWVGGVHEIPLPGALLGPTFVCIIGDQFARSKKSDRFFYDIADQPHSFTKDQIQDIRQVSMARIICDNSDKIFSTQPLVFHLPSNGFNPVLPCDSPSIPRLDFSNWG